MRIRMAAVISLFALAVTVMFLSGGCRSTSRQSSDASAAQAEATARRLAAPEEALARKAEAAGDKQGAVRHYVAALQSLPEGDVSEIGFRLRSSIISLALSMSPLPAVSPEAQRHFDQAALILRDSKDEVACARAAQEFEASLRLAPWNADAYYNLGALKELAKDNDSAIRNYKLYLLAAPGSPDARAVQNKVAALELARPKTGLAALEGIWRYVKDDGTVDSVDNHTYGHHYVFQVQGREIVGTFVRDADDPDVKTWLKGDKYICMRFSLEGRRIRGRFLDRISGGAFSGRVSEDFSDIQLSYDTGGLDRDNNPYYLNWRLRRFDN